MRQNTGGEARTVAVFHGDGEPYPPSSVPVASAILRFQVPSGLDIAVDSFDIGVRVQAGRNYRDGYSLSRRTIEMDILMLYEKKPKLSKPKNVVYPM